MHNNIMAAGSRDRPPMLAPGRYPQWYSQFVKYVDTRANGEALRKCILSGPYKPTTVLVQAVEATDDSPAVLEHTTVETPMNMSPENEAHFLEEKEAIHLILTGIGDDIYSTVDACQTAKETWEAIERLQQVNELRAEKLARNANPLALVATAQASQDPYYQTSRSHRSSAPSPKPSIPSRSHTTTRHKGKEIAKPITPLSETTSKEDNDPEQSQRDKDMQKNLALIAKYFKKIYKPTNNNLRTSSNSKNKNVDTTAHKGKEIAKPITPLSETTSKEDNDPEQSQRDKDMQKNLALIAKYFKKIYKPTNNNLRTSSNSKNKNVDTTLRFKNDNQLGQVGNQRTVNVAAARENIGSKQAEQGVPLQAEQYDWLAVMDEEVDEQELEAHYSYMAKIQEVPIADSGTDSEPVEHNEQNDVESDDERVTLNNLIANLKLDVDENKKIQKKLKKANTTLAQKLKECKAILAETSKSLGESISVRDSCLVALQTKQAEFEKYKAFNDHTIDYEKLDCKLNEALGQLAHKDTVIREGLKTKAYELSVVKEKHDELMKQSLLTRSHYEGLVKQKTKTCLMPLSIKTHSDSLKFVHELKQEMHADLKYVESLEKEIDQLESDKAEFSDMYDEILQDCVSKDVMCSYLQSLSDLDALAELQCMYLHKVKECDRLAQKLSKQTESVSKKVHTELLQRFAKVEKQSISLELSLQKCKEQVKIDTVCNDKASNVFRKEREQYFKIQDLKAQLQDKNIPISELKKLIEKGKGKFVDTKFDRPFVVRQPNAQRIPKPSVLGVNHKPTVSRPQLKSNQSKDKVLPNNSHVKAKKTQVEVHPRIPSVSNKMKVLYENTNKAWKWWIEEQSPSGYKLVPKPKKQWVPKAKMQWVAENDQVPKRHMTGNLKLLCNFVEKFLGTIHFGNDQFAPILGYGDLVQGNIMINRVYYVEGLNHNLLSVIQFCDADLEVAFRKSTCFVRDFQGNDLLTAKRSSFKSKAVPSSKGRLNFLHMDLCGPMRVASIKWKKYILVIVDDYSRYTWTLFLRSKDETPEVLKEFLTMI
nr:integrase, catalytic region, zinc finger, CCHC-type, peptidase aspartic, catalytic [Tanacetum cinerariifolium]